MSSKGGGALEVLLEGNRRFTEGNHREAGERPDLAGLTDSQSPFAAVLCCSDSRVPPEHIFDQGFGRIFVVRVAGNIAGESEVGSLEYAVDHLHVPLLLVLGHEGCGAVKAALGDGAQGALGRLLERLVPAVKPVLRQGEGVEDAVTEAVEANIWYTMNRLIRESPVIDRGVQAGRLLLKGACYSLSSGEVRMLTEES